MHIFRRNQLLKLCIKTEPHCIFSIWDNLSVLVHPVGLFFQRVEFVTLFTIKPFGSVPALGIRGTVAREKKLLWIFPKYKAVTWVCVFYVCVSDGQTWNLGNIKIIGKTCWRETTTQWYGARSTTSTLWSSMSRPRKPNHVPLITWPGHMILMPDLPILAAHPA